MFTTLIWMCLDQKDALVGLSYSKSLLRAWKGMTSQHHVIFLAAVIHIPIHVDLEWYATNIYGSVSRLAAPKTLNCFILGFGFNGSFSTHSPKCIEGNSLYAAKIEPENHPELKRKNHLPKLQFLGFQRYISRVAVPRLDRAMSDPCLNWDHIPTEQQTWKHFHRSRRRFQSRFTSGHGPRAPRKNTNRWVTLIVFKVEAMSGRLRCENGNMFSEFMPFFSNRWLICGIWFHMYYMLLSDGLWS